MCYLGLDFLVLKLFCGLERAELGLKQRWAEWRRRLEGVLKKDLLNTS